MVNGRKDIREELPGNVKNCNHTISYLQQLGHTVSLTTNQAPLQTLKILSVRRSRFKGKETCKHGGIMEEHV
jgi:hypothetical protein